MRPEVIRPKPLVLIICEQCGQSAMRKPGSIFCWECLRARLSAAAKRRQVARVIADPDYYKKARDYKLEWDRKQREKLGPLPCVVCGAPLARRRGRHANNAICPTDKKLAREYRNTKAVANRRKRRLSVRKVTSWAI